MIDVLTFGNKSFSDFNTFFDGSLTFEKPSKSVEFFSVVGKNGDLSISNDRFENIKLTIKCFIRQDFKTNYSALIDYLSSLEGYQRLETTEEPETYRMAQFVDAVKPSTGTFIHYGSFSLVFNCKPQVFLKEGEKEITITNNLALQNPTYKKAKPLIKVRGTGSITIGGKTLTLSQNTGQTFIDCETQDAYEGTINRNGNLTITSEFPYLDIGKNTITFSGFSNVVIIPRWWRL